MKKIALLISLLFIACSGFSQSMMAKLKYEDAEAAYQSKDYKLAITKLDETEALLKSSNPRTLYLRVMAQFKIIESGNAKDFTIIESARKLSTTYLTKYETVPNNEDKYRDIYKVSEGLNAYPKTATEFNEQFAAKEAERKKYEVPAGTLEGLLEQYQFKLGLSPAQFIAYNPEVKEFTERVRPFRPDSWGDLNAQKGPSSIYSKNNKVYRYERVITASDDNEYLQKIFKAYSDLLYKLDPTPVTTTSTQTTVVLTDVHITVTLEKGRLLIAFTDSKS